MMGFLRVSGGVSLIAGEIEEKPEFSPRKRRCFFGGFLLLLLKEVFSA